MSGLLDVALVVLLLAYLVYGFRSGLIRSIGAIVGVVAGAIAATFVSPLLANVVQDAPTRVIATVVVSCVLILVGHALGATVGHVVASTVVRGPLGIVDRVLGGAVNVVVAALVVSVVASSVVALGVPFLAQPIAGSTVLRTIGALTPPPVTRALAQLRNTVVQDGLPQLGEALGTPVQRPEVPSAPQSEALTAAARSVVKVSGTAYACGQDQSGSGFVIAPNRVLTNAHVLTGVSSPVVLTSDGDAHVGSIVHFDPHSDLAVVAVPGLAAPVLRVGAPPDTGATGVVQGYPFGGPFTSSGARVLSVSEERVHDVVGDGSTVRSLATLAADVEQGDSGGPLLSKRGTVLGIVFAKSATTSDVGYAMTPRQFSGIVREAADYRDPVSSGACVRG
jgi:S1-C subfamily serine protease